MNILSEIIRKDKEYGELRTAVLGAFAASKPLPLVVSGLCEGAVDAATVSLIGDIRRARGGTALIVCSEEKECRRLVETLSCFGIAAAFYESRDLNLYNITASHEFEHERLRVLFGMLHGNLDAVVTTPDAALGYTIPPEKMVDLDIRIDFDTRVDLRETAARLVAAGYSRVETVEAPGQFAVRGGILDIFPPTARAKGEKDSESEIRRAPFRVELFGDEVDRIGTFDPESQRFLNNYDGIEFPPAREVLPDRAALEEIRAAISAHFRHSKNETACLGMTSEIASLDAAIENGESEVGFADKYISVIYPQRVCLLDYFSEKSLLVLRSPLAVAERLKNSGILLAHTVTDLLEGGTIAAKYTDYAVPDARFDKFCRENVRVCLDSISGGLPGERLGGLFTFRTKQTVVYDEKIDLLCEDIGSYRASGFRTLVLVENESRAKNICGYLCDRQISASVETENGDFTAETLPVDVTLVLWRTRLRGFELSAARYAVLSLCPEAGSGSAAAKNRLMRRGKKKKASETILSTSDLEIGDYVVHESFGIGKYEGIENIVKDGVGHDYINIRYAGSGRLFLPVERLDMVSKYIGAREEDGIVKLSALGGAEWGHAKARAKLAVKDIAKDLIRLYAERMRRGGYAFPKDDEMQKEFEDAFEYDATDAQLDAIDEIKEDMEKSTPMDRLLCGDVGYGKTEVAFRAAYKAVLGGKQVAILVPTTILALQHYQTALSRMRAFGVEVDMVSRFRTPKQVEASLRKLARGETDMIIGTHRLLSKDVSFKNLGLLIVDEEQRFGVAQKEKIKQMAGNIDVLSLSATPIPRTLNMAMGGFRDISVLDEAPCDRLPVQTYVLEEDELILSEAIRRELRRGGQVFYMHNFVDSISSVASRIAREFPDAVIRYAHGQMDKEQLEDIWNSMLTGETDILVCTSIIETGIDVPNANTLIVDNAHRLGLSQLHQLRGRVGRSSRRAYAYFTYPKNMAITDISQKRLEAIRDYAEFGAGFRIAMRDLELRGAGDLLGARQHGHLDAVGYDLYIKLLNEAVLEEKGVEVKKEEECKISLAFDAFLPEKYVSFAAERVVMYKRIALIRNTEDYYDISDELIDRYGEMPPPAKNLLMIALVRGLGLGIGIASIEGGANGIDIYPGKIDIDVWMELAEKFGNCLKMNLSSKTSIRLSPAKAEKPLSGKPLELLYRIFEQYVQISQKNAQENETCGKEETKE